MWSVLLLLLRGVVKAAAPSVLFLLLPGVLQEAAGGPPQDCVGRCGAEGVCGGTRTGCSSNGACVSGACVCDAGWRGEDCGALDLEVGTARRLWPPDGRFDSTSSWGGSVVLDEGGHHRLFVSEMAEGCGLGTWRTNSQIVTSKSKAGPLGPYKSSSARPLVRPFGHNAMLIRGTAQSPHVLMHIGGYDASPKTGCGGGITGGARGGRRETARPRGRRRLLGKPSFGSVGSRVLFSESLDGPWNATRIGCGARRESQLCDFANPSMAVDPETGFAVAAYKLIHGPRRGAAISFATATTWRGPFEPVSDRWNANPAIPCGVKQYWACEDPFLWRSPDGVYHVLFHHGDGRTKEDLGGHAFSTDGAKTWTLSETNAYPNNYTTSDGVSHRFKRPQRPQLLLDDAGTPMMLILGVAGAFDSDEPGMCSPPSQGPGCDKSYTLGVPVRRRRTSPARAGPRERGSA